MFNDNQKAKPLTDSQLNTLKELGYTKKELKAFATIKCKNFYMKNVVNPGDLVRIEEDGNIKQEIS